MYSTETDKENQVYILLSRDVEYMYVLNALHLRNGTYALYWLYKVIIYIIPYDPLVY